MPNVKALMSNEIQSPNVKKQKWHDGTLEFYWVLNIDIRLTFEI